MIELFVRHQTRIRGFIASLMGDFAAVPDVLQETFLVIQRKAGEFEPGSNFMAWAFQIARFQVMKAQSRHKRTAGRFSDRVIESLAASAPEALPDEPKISALDGCLERLAPQARRTVDLFYQGEHKPAEIARMMGWTPLSVSVALSRARKFLRECIEHELGRSQA